MSEELEVTLIDIPETVSISDVLSDNIKVTVEKSQDSVTVVDQSNNTGIAVPTFSDEITVESSIRTETIVLHEEVIQVVGIAEQGPPGAKGDKGESNYELNRVRIQVVDLEVVTQVLPHNPIPLSLEVLLNGIVEDENSFSVVGNIVNYSALDLGIGDTLVFKYVYSL